MMPGNCFYLWNIHYSLFFPGIVIPASMYQTVVTSMADAQVITTQAGNIGTQPVQIVTAPAPVANGEGQPIQFKTEQVQGATVANIVPTATQAVEVVAMETQQQQQQQQVVTS